jgi:hypothetical protein
VNSGAAPGNGHHSRLAVGLLVAALAGSAVLLALVGDDESPPRGDQGGPPRAATVGANCERFGGLTYRSILRRASNVQVGPITFISLGEYARQPPSDFAPVRPASLREPWIRGRADALVHEEVRERSLYVAHKVIVVIEGARDVTVAIPRSQRRHAALLWGPQPGVTRSEARLGFAQISDGNPAVRFKGCNGQFMEYVGGGFVIAGKRCLPLDLWVEGERGARRVAASFGAGEGCAATW